MRFSLAPSAVLTGLREAFDALSAGDYRWFVAGKVTSVFGSYLGSFAANWALLELTHSGMWVSVREALFSAPLLLFGPAAGRIADRVAKRRLLLFTQAAWMLNELALFSAVALGLAVPWMLCGSAATRGVINAVDLPARESFLGDLVDHDRVGSAVALKNTASYVGQITGPLAAALLIARFSVTPCFAIDAGTCALMLIALAAIKTRGHSAGATTEHHDRRQPWQLLELVRNRPQLWIPMGALVILGVFSLNLVVLAPLLASQAHLGASGYATLSIAVGAGSAVGALLSGTIKRLGPSRLIAPAAAAVGIIELLAATATSLPWQTVALGLLGLAAALFAAAVNSHLLLVADPAVRGRVMALYGIGLVGSTALGGPLVAWITDTWSARGELLVAGAAAALTAVAVSVANARARPHA
jgi:MFS family permease